MKKKVMFLISGLGKGGAEVMLLKLLPRLKKRYDILLVSLLKKDDVGKEIEKKGIEIIYLNKGKFNLVRSVLGFRRIVKSFKPDLLFTFLIHADVFGRVLGKVFGVKKIYCSVRNDYSKVTKFYVFDRFTRGLVDLYVPNSKSLDDYLYKKVKAKEEKVVVIPNAVDLKEIEKSAKSSFDVRNWHGISKSTTVIASVGRFKNQKDYPTLIRAIDVLKNKYKRKVSLVLVGYGSEEENLKMLVAELGLGKEVIFPGACYEERLSIVSKSDIFVLPSLTEGMSNALLEAMSLKTVCVTSDIKQNKVLIMNNKNGLTFKVGNEKDLAKKIDLLIGDSKLRRKFERKAYEDILEDYEIGVVAKKFEELIG